MRSLESRMVSSRCRVGSKSAADSSSRVLTAFCSRTQSIARSLVTSSSQRYGSSGMGETPPESGWGALAAVSPLTEVGHPEMSSAARPAKLTTECRCKCFIMQGCMPAATVPVCAQKESSFPGAVSNEQNWRKDDAAMPGRDFMAWQQSSTVQNSQVMSHPLIACTAG